MNANTPRKKHELRDKENEARPALSLSTDTIGRTKRGLKWC